MSFKAVGTWIRKATIIIIGWNKMKYKTWHLIIIAYWIVVTYIHIHLIFFFREGIFLFLYYPALLPAKSRNSLGQTSQKNLKNQIYKIQRILHKLIQLDQLWEFGAISNSTQFLRLWFYWLLTDWIISGLRIVKWEMKYK